MNRRDPELQPSCHRTRFLQRLLDDEEHDRLQSVEHYEAEFPELVPFVRAEYAALMRSDQSSPTLRTAVGRYLLRGEIGSGGMGAVQLADDPELGRRVVVKTPHRSLSQSTKARERLRREARTLGSVDHPNVLKVIDLVEDGGELHLVVPFHEGKTLGEHLAAARSASSDQAGPRLRLGPAVSGGESSPAIVRFFVRAAEALHAAHAVGIVHRDVKPENILVQPDGSPMLLDFGLALPDDELRFTSIGELVGTPQYMAPEQVEGGPATPATDVYALGVCLYESLTLVHPFAGPGGRSGVYKRILAGDPVPPRKHQPRLSRDLEAVVLRAMHREPDRRYPDGAAFARDLQRVLELEPTEARPVTVWTQMWRRAGRQPWLVAATCAFVVASVAAIWLYAENRAALSALTGEGSADERNAGAVDILRSPVAELAPFEPLLPLLPVGRVRGIDCLQWIGYPEIDPTLPGTVQKHSYALVVFAADGSVILEARHEQAAGTNVCTVPLSAGLPANAHRWSVQWVGSTGAGEEDVPPEKPIFSDFQVVPTSVPDDRPPDEACFRNLLEMGYAAEVLAAVMLQAAPQGCTPKDWLLLGADAAKKRNLPAIEGQLSGRAARLEVR